MKKIWLCVLFLLCSVLISCDGTETGGKDGGITTIKFVCNAGYVAEFEGRIAEFEKLHPEINVEIQGIAASSWGEMLNTISLDIISGNGPDIADIASEGMYTFAESGLLEPIDSYLERDREEMAETLAEIDSNLINSHKINGKLYSLPTVWNNMCIYYNKSVLKAAGLEEPQAGWTTEDFLQMCKEVSKNNTGGAKDIYGYSFYQSYFTTLEPWLQAFNSSILSDDWTESTVNTTNAKQAFSYLYDLVNNHKVSPAMGSDDAQLFTQNRLAFLGAGMWYVEKLKNMGFGAEQYDVVPWPSVDGQVHSVIGVGGAPIFKDSKHKEEAWELAKFLSSKDFQSGFLSNSIWAIPSVKTAADTVFAKSFFPNNAQIFWDAATYGKYVPAPAAYTAIESTILREFGAYMAGVKTLDVAMSDAQKKMNEALGN